MSARFAGAASLWDRKPGLISLRTLMDELFPALVAGIFSGIKTASARLCHITPGRLPMPRDIVDGLEAGTFAWAETVCRRAGLPQSLASLERLRHDFRGGIGCAAAAHTLDAFSDLLTNEMADCHVYLVPKDRLRFHENERLFGDAVHDAFPSARMDIYEAGNCWLFGRNNAVAYHLMNAAEIGLRALARDRRVVLHKGRPLEFAQWGDIIRSLDKEVERIIQWPPSPVRATAQQFYSDALLSVRAFNNGHRTHINHARGRPYHDDETQALMGYVERFLRGLAQYISEAKRTPVEWKRLPPPISKGAP
jgi:hypothetical protein